MVQVQFFLVDRINYIPLVGIEVVLDGVSVTSNENGLTVFDNITQGIHSYQVEMPTGYTLDYGQDAFLRPLAISGTFTIEWEDGGPYPEEIPWINRFFFVPYNGNGPVIDIKSIAIPGIVGTVLIFTILRV